MNNAATLAAAVLAGGALGAIFFGGLWWTVCKGLSSSRPGRWFFASLLLRTGIVLTGFYFVADGGWERLVACLLAFLAARLIITRLIRVPAARQARSSKEVSHAP